MGIIRSNAHFLLGARRRGVDFSRTVTLGRQRLYLTDADWRQLRSELGGLCDADGLRYGEPADVFLQRCLGVHDLQTLDHSDYEGASLLHDLNVPLPAALAERFDAVIESGTLEHVFNFPVAIASCMNLVRNGGTLFLSTPANNLCGHGFYQLSPELYFRLFDDANGFELVRMILVTHPFPGAELSGRQTWFAVADPADIGRRAPLMTQTPAFLMVEARRTRVVPLIAAPPMQSDYVAAWSRAADGSPPPPRARAASFLRAVRRRLPPSVERPLTGWYQRLFMCSLRNSRAFTRLDPRAAEATTPSKSR